MKEIKIKRYRGLLALLVLSTVLLGFLTVFVVNLPLLLCGLFSQRCWRWSQPVTHLGLSLLQAVQPWWRGSLEVHWPTEVDAGDKGCLFVSNHRSHLDVFLLLEKIPGIRVLTKHHIFLIPGLGQAAVLFRMIPIRRGASDSFWKAMAKIEVALRTGDRVHVFPEMTRARFGQTEIGRFTLAPFQKAISAGVPVVPVVIWGTDFLWPRGVYRIALRGPLVVESLDPVSVAEFQSASELSEYVRGVLQKRINELAIRYPYGEFS